MSSLHYALMFKYQISTSMMLLLNVEFITTNSAEGYNDGLASALQENSGTWTLIARLKLEDASDNLKLRDALLGSQNIEHCKKHLNCHEKEGN